MNAGWRVEGLVADLDGFRLGPVDLEVPPGHAVAVLGPSGAGKTTFLRTLAGFLPVRAGRLLRDGLDVTGLPPEARGLGYVPQGLGLLTHRTVEGNVRFPLEVRGRSNHGPRVRDLLERMQLTALAHRPVSRLSGGEQQRVAIARALAAEPTLLVWDEPWQGLDVLARHELGELLHQLRSTERVPLLVVTHDPALAFSVADTFLVLREGRVDAHCDASTLLRAPPDAFVARFVGLPNVFDRAALAGARTGSLGAWLRERAGPDGIAFAAHSLAPPALPPPVWSGSVRSVRPVPAGLELVVEADGLIVRLALAGPVRDPLPRVGSSVSFAIGPEALHPLGASGGAT